MTRRQVVLLLGAPGAGKGTQARFLTRILDLPHVASGDLLREHRRLGTPLGRAAQQYMDRYGAQHVFLTRSEEEFWRPGWYANGPPRGLALHARRLWETALPA